MKEGNINVYCFGDKYLDKENTVYRLMKNISIDGFDTVFYSDPAEMDNTTELLIVTDISTLTEMETYYNVEDFMQIAEQSLHNMKLATQLKLLKELGFLKKVKIIGIPEDGDIIKIRNSLAEELVRTKNQEY
jgi:hypothetical protein